MQQASIYSAESEGRFVLKFIGDVRLTLCASLDCHLEKVLSHDSIEEVLVDLTETVGIDSTSLGLIAKLAVKARKLNLPNPTIVSTNPDVTRVLYSMGFDHIFLLLEQLPTSPHDLKQLPLVQESEEEMRTRIIEAHRVLMELNDQNREAFKDLVATLESAK